MTTGEKIAKFRKQAGYSQETLGEKLGVSRQAVSKWENGSARPTSENCAQLARLFGVSVSALLDDGDVNLNRGEPKDNTEKSGKGKIKGANILLCCLAAALLIADIARASSIKNMKNDIARLENRLYRISSLESEISSLRSYIGSISSSVPDTVKGFSDYRCEIVSYDYDLNTALLKFSVVPSDYTEKTRVSIAVKGKSGTQSADAKYENGVFVAETEVLCDGEMSVYMYMTDGGRTRSFVLGYINDPSENYILTVSGGIFDGKITAKDGKLNLEGSYNINVQYAVNRDKSKSVYPKKAVLNIYADGQLVSHLPHSEAMDYDWQSEGEWLAPYEEKGVSTVYFGIYLDEAIEAKGVKKGSEIVFEYTVTDTQGREYVHKSETYRAS